MKNNIYFDCKGFKVNEKLKKPLFFYHVPKCGGTTFGDLLGFINKNSCRVPGTLFRENDKKGITAYENFTKVLLPDPKKQFMNFDFLYGHLPFEVHKYIHKYYHTCTILRDPISRSISHYKWAIVRKLIEKNMTIEEVFNKQIIPSNALVNFFSGKGFNHNNHSESLKNAIQNIKKINYIIHLEDIYKFINLIISNYDLPNVLFQNRQVNLDKKNIKIDNSDYAVFEKNNILDMELFQIIKNKKLFFNLNEKYKQRDTLKYFFLSINSLINGKKTALLNNDQAEKVKIKLIKNNFIIESV